jgi:drug/metabolite transporter (DMT)-like permease
MRLAIGLVLALLSAAALNVGFFVQHGEAAKLPPLSLRRPVRSLAALFTNWRWIAGFGAGLGGWALYIVALVFAPLSLVQAVSAGGVGLLALLVRLRGVKLSRREIWAVAAAVTGLLLVGLSLPAGTHSTGQTTGPPLAWVLGSVLLAGLAVCAARLMRPGAGLAVAAGLLYAAGDVATKAAVGRISPLVIFVLLIPACHGLAFVSVQMSFQRGAALATAGVTTLLTNVLPIAAGLIVFHEQMPGGPAGVLRWLGFAGAVLGATLLTGRDAGHEDQGAGTGQQPRPNRREHAAVLPTSHRL